MLAVTCCRRRETAENFLSYSKTFGSSDFSFGGFLGQGCNRGKKGGRSAAKRFRVWQCRVTCSFNNWQETCDALETRRHLLPFLLAANLQSLRTGGLQVKRSERVQPVEA